MNSAIEELVRSLLYEGYALYPYTPGVKNATPTPFGIVYPPGYAEAQPAAFSMLQARGRAPGRSRRPARRHRPLPAGHRRAPRGRRAVARAGPGDPGRAGARAPCARPSASRWTRRVSCEAGSRCAPSCSRRTLARIRLCVHNETEMPGDPTETSRGDALRHSLISTHPLLEVEGGRFVSPLEREGPEGGGGARQRAGQHLSGAGRRGGPGGSRRGDRAPGPPGARAGEPRQPLRQHGDRGGAAAPRARASARTSASEISDQDPAVKEMIERAASTTGEDIMGLHGRLTYTEPDEDSRRANGRPPSPPPGLDEIKGRTRGLRRGRDGPAGGQDRPAAGNRG